MRVTDTIAIDEREIDERFVRASGPGGQNVNKVSTAVELRFDVRASSLPSDVKERLLAVAGSRMTADGVLLIDSREHRTQAQNREAARQRLVDLVAQAAKKPTTAQADEASPRGARETPRVQETAQPAERASAEGVTASNCDQPAGSLVFRSSRYSTIVR